MLRCQIAAAKESAAIQVKKCVTLTAAIISESALGATKFAGFLFLGIALWASESFGVKVPFNPSRARLVA